MAYAKTAKFKNANTTPRTPRAVNLLLLQHIVTITLKDIALNTGDRTNTPRAQKSIFILGLTHQTMQDND